MENFSLEWFKAQIDESVNKALDKRLIEKEDGHNVAPLIRNIKLVNDTLTIVLQDGSILSKPCASEIDCERASMAETREELFTIIFDKTIQQEKEQKTAELDKQLAIVKGFDLLKLVPDFVIDGNNVSFKGTGRTLPPLLVEEFISLINEFKPEDNENPLWVQLLMVDDRYQALKNFFMWCCLNPRAEVADQLYDFLNRNSFRITKQGFFVALRNVVTLDGSSDKELLHFITNSYNKVKAVWKKKPDNFRVVNNNGSFSLEDVANTTPKGTIVGNLTTLYKEIPSMSENRYTDAHTGTFDIRVGQVVNMPMEDCSWSTADCAEAGLHFTSDEIHYVGCGDTSVLILINPMKVVGIGSFKGRCYEYLPIMTVPREEATKILHDGKFDTLQLDEQYALDELEHLGEKVKAGFTAETTKYEFNLPSISSNEINNIILSLGDMTNSISKRVKNID